MPKDGGVVLCSNHISLLDPPAIGILLKRRIRFMAKAELFNIPVFGAAIKALGAFLSSGAASAKKRSARRFNCFRTGILWVYFLKARVIRTNRPQRRRGGDDCAPQRRGCRSGGDYRQL